MEIKKAKSWNQFDFKIRKSRSSNSNSQEQWRKQWNSVTKKEYWKNVNENKTNDNIKEKSIIKTKKKLNFGFKHLKELCDKDPSEIVFVMSNITNGFMNLFKQYKDPDWIILLMKVSAKFVLQILIKIK